MISLPAEMDPLLILSLIILGGGAGGWIARRLHVPGITGNILAGIILGYTILESVDAAKELQALSNFAMALIAASVGGHLSYRRVHNALRRIIGIALLESMGAILLVTFAIHWFLDVAWPVAALLGAMAVETAPATTVSVISETRSKGSFVKTLLSVVAIDNILCIMFFVFIETLDADYYAHPGTSLGVGRAFMDTGGQLFGSLMLGLGLGKLTDWVVRYSRRFSNFSTTFVAILVSTGLSQYLGMSPLLSALFFGMYLGNSSAETEKQLTALDPIEPLLHICFFTLAGAGIHLEHLYEAGLLCVLYVIARLAGKALGSLFGGILSRTSRRIWSSIPLALMPQSAVAIGLVVILEGDPRIPESISSYVGTLVLAAVAINEIIGPLLTRIALHRSREVGLDRPRLMEFLQEEFIHVGLEAEDKWDALKKLVDFFAHTHNVPPKRTRMIYDTVIEREENMSTAVGLGAALPHGRVDVGSGIQGVMATCRKGIDFDAPDGEPVKLIVLIVTPKEHEKRHLEVIASLSAMISNERIRERIIAAINANDAWEIIESEEARGHNYFIEELEEQNVNGE
jgi:fructose PTS system EIIBC or EIIC component